MLEAGRSTLYDSCIAFHHDHATGLENEIEDEENTQGCPASSATASTQHKSPVTTATQTREAPMEAAADRKSEPRSQGSLRHYMGLMGTMRLVIFSAFVLLLVGLSVGQSRQLLAQAYTKAVGLFALCANIENYPSNVAQTLGRTNHNRRGK